MKMAISMCAQFKPESNLLSSTEKVLGPQVAKLSVRKGWDQLETGNLLINYGLGWNPSSILLSFLLSFLLHAQNREWNLESILEVKKNNQEYILFIIMFSFYTYTLTSTNLKSWILEWIYRMKWWWNDEMTEWFHFAPIASSVRLIYLKSQHCQYFSFELLLKHALPYPHFVVVFRKVCKVCLLLNYLGLHDLKVRIFITVE